MSETKLPHYRYLIVDDDQFTCDLIAGLLRKRGASQIETADDGKTAIKQIAAAKSFADIIICDLNMPGLDGVEFVQYLADEYFTGGLILMSGTDQIILNAVSRLGKANFIRVLGAMSKPFTPETLFGLIDKYAEFAAQNKQDTGS